MNDTLTETVENVTSATDESNVLKELYDVAKVTNAIIIILGLVTNSLIIVVLRRSTIGSATTKIILLFLAGSDLLVMVLELVLHYIPRYWRWFPVYYDNTCGIALAAQSTIVTCSSWYVTLMTLERFIVVILPLKARLICTKKTIIGSCICIPFLCVLTYAYHFTSMVPYIDDGYMLCKPRQDQGRDVFKAIMQIWVVAYFFVPALLIVILNMTIVFKLRGASDSRRKLTHNAKIYKQCNIADRGDNTNHQEKSKATIQERAVRKATVLVIVASVIFVLLMIPRGVSTTISANRVWKYQSKPLKIFGAVSYLLQYLNHATNFFVYVLANASFRKELVNLFRCRKKLSHSALNNTAFTSYTMETTMEGQNV